ncbi:hypothetical protein Tco_1257601, partial [Tanacetum coccineum]
MRGGWSFKTNALKASLCPSDTKQNRIMDLKLEYQTFKTKSTKSLSQTYTRYKTLLNKLANDGVNLSKHESTFIYEDNLIQRRYSDTKKALITTPSRTAISIAFFSNNVIQDFQENSDDEVDERSSEEYLRDLDIEYHKRALLANSKRHFARDCFSKTFEPYYKSPVNNYSSVSKGFQPKFTPKLIQSSSNSSSQVDPKFQKDYKAGYKKMKAKLALLEAKEVTEDEEVTQVKVLMALADDELTVGNNHARNGECVDITIRKKVLGGKLFTESSSKMNENENLFVHASMEYGQEMVLKPKDWVERLNPDSKLPNINTGRILVLESEAINEPSFIFSKNREWSDGNISTLIHVLKCFFHASGLKINLNKSKIMGINVESAQVIQAAAKLGCL